MPVLNPYPTNAYDGVKGLPSEFWGAPVLRDDNGELYCPGYTGNAYSSNGRDKVFIQVPFGSGNYPSQPYTPGICTVDASKAREFDEKKAKGRDGGRLTTHGLNLGEVDITITIWTPQQLLELQRLWAIIFPGFTKTETHKVAGARSTTSVTASGDTTTENADGSFKTNRNFSTVTIPQVGSKKAHNVTTKVASNVASPFQVSHPDLSMHGIQSLLFVRGSGLTVGSTTGTRVFKMTCKEYVKPGTVNVTKTAVAAKGSVLDGGPSLPGSDPGNLRP